MARKTGHTLAQIPTDSFHGGVVSKPLDNQADKLTGCSNLDIPRHFFKSGKEL